MHGKIAAVTTRNLGAEVITASTGTLVQVDNAAVFDATGGSVSINDVVRSYTSCDPETDAITLATPASVAVGDYVDAFPLLSVTIAQVIIDEEGGSLPALVPHEMKSFLPEGIRDDPGNSETVEVERKGGGLVIVDVLGRRASIDAEFIDNAEELLLADQVTLGEKLAEARAEREAAVDRITEAEGLLDDAFSQIDILPDAAYVEAAKQQAIDAAAITAQQKADQAEADAAIDAQTKATAAKNAAILDAQGKLATAKTALEDAISSGDATTIAAAEAKVLAAKAAAAADATTKANQARVDAIAAAQLDATNKLAEAMEVANAALSAADAAQSTADGAIRTYYSATPPWADGSTQPDEVLGDMWYNDDTGQAYRWNGTTWTVIVDQTVGQALSAAQNAQDTADGKITAFYQDTEPLAADTGDLWFDTNDNNKPHHRSGSAWISLEDARIAAQASAIGDIQTDLTGLEGTLDGKSNVWVQAAAPTPMTTADKGDIWINDGVTPRTTKVWNGSAWIDADSRITKAVADVATKITTYYTANTTAPTGTFVNGDLWIDINGKIARRSATAWVTVSDPKGLADAALLAAKADATAKADAAREAAKTAAAADATAKAEAAESNAAATAAADATTKANAAQADAEAAAQAYADSVSAGEGAGALAAAKTYAEQKAEAARVAAEAAAALDATAKAEQAEADAAATAALDATAKADAAQAAAEAASAAAEQRALSRGTDLVTNGTGYLKSNYNFSDFTYDPTDAPIGSTGSFKYSVRGYGSARTDEPIPYDPNKKYLFSVTAKHGGEYDVDAQFQPEVIPFDAEGEYIYYHHYQFVEGTTTTLAQPLNSGDTTMTLTDASGWTAGLRGAIFWNYTDSLGRAWPSETYSRSSANGNGRPLSISGNVVTLRFAWSSGNFPAGTSLSQAAEGSYDGLVLPMPNDGMAIPSEWTAYSGVLNTTNSLTSAQGASFENGLPPGTAFVRVGIRTLNWMPGEYHSIAGVSFSDASAAQVAADAAAASVVGIQSDLTGIQGQVDGKSNIYVQSGAPAGMGANDKGDIWINDGVVPRVIKTWTGAVWIEADSRTAEVVADVKTKIVTYYTVTTTAPGTPVGGFNTGDLWIDSNGKIARWSSSAWVTVSDPKAYTDATAAVLRQQALDSAANAANLIANPSFEQGLDGWTQGTASLVVIEAAGARTGTNRARFNAAGGNSELWSNAIRVNNGETYRLSIWGVNGGGTAGPAGLRLQLSSDGGTTWTSGVSVGGWVDKSVTSTGWMELSSDYTVHSAGVTHIRMRLASALSTGYTVFDDASVKDLTESKRLEALANDVEQRALSRGTDLVTNGTGYLKSNYNFSGFTYTGADAPVGSSGSFLGVSGVYTLPRTDELIPVDPSKRYLLSAAARQVGATPPAGRMLGYTFALPYDSSGAAIDNRHYLFQIGSTTTLVADLKPGDTTIQLTDSANWYGTPAKPAGAATHYRCIIFWDYTDDFGKKWPEETYSRNVSGNSYWADGGISAGHVITLAAPYAGMVHPAGTKVSNGNGAGSYAYLGWTGQQPTSVWQARSYPLTGVADPARGNVVTGNPATPGAMNFPPGTAAMRIGFLSNYSPTAGCNIAWGAVSLSDASAAQATADAVSATLVTVQGSLTGLEGKVDGKANIFVQAGAPAGLVLADKGDIWINNGVTPRIVQVWTGSAWVEADSRTTQAVSDIAKKTTTFTTTGIIAPTAPAEGFTAGDLWLDVNGKIARWSGTAWAAMVDPKSLADAAEAAAKLAAQGWVNALEATALSGVSVEYSVSASETVAPTTGWSTTTPTRAPGTFIWYRSVSTRGNGSTTTSNPALLTGNAGTPGAAGAAAVLVSLTATTQVLTSPATGGATAPATAVVTGMSVNEAIIAWTYSINGATFTTTVPPGTVRSGNVVTITGSTMTAKTITVKMATSSGVSDTLTVAKVADGGVGAPGADAYTVVLSNEAHVFAGSTTAALAGSTTSSVIAYKGATQQSATVGTITGHVTGLTTAIAGNGTAAPVITITATTALVTKNGTLTVPVTVDSKVFTKTIAWSVANQGSIGITGVSVSSVTPYFRTVVAGAAAPALPTGATPAAPWASTEPAYAANVDLYRSERIVFSNATTVYTPVTLVSAYTAAKEAEANAKAFATTRTDGLAKTLWSTALPGTTTAPQNSVWYQTDAGGKIIAVFTQTATGIATTWAARPITSEAIDNLDLGKLTVGGTSTLNQAVINSLVAQIATFVKADIENLTVTETSNLNNVVAERIWGNIASFAEVTADKVLAGNIQAVWTITSEGLIICGDPEGARVEIAQDGIRLFTLGYNGLPREAVTLVNNGEIAFQIHDQARGYVAGFSANGDVKGQQANFAGLTVKGSDVLGQLGGGAAPGWLDLLPRGIVRSGALSTSTSGSAPERVYARVIVTLQPGRRYRIVGSMYVNIGTQGALRVRIRYENGGGAVTTSSTVLGDPATSGLSYMANIGIDQRTESFYFVAAPTKIQFAVTYEGVGGATPGGRGGRVYVEDVGPIGLTLDDEGETPKTTYTTTWRATASRGYDKTGATIPAKENEINLWYFGSTVAESAGVLFGDVAETVTDISEQGRTIPQALNTATIHSVELQVTNAMWWDENLANLAVNALGASTLPATKVVEGATLVKNIPEGASIWINLDPAPWLNGVNRGVTLGDKDNTLSGPQMGAGSFQGPGDPDAPLLRITYSR